MDDGAREAEWVLNNLGEMISEFYEGFFFGQVDFFFPANLGCNHFCNCQWVKLHSHQRTLWGKKKKKKESSYHWKQLL